MHPNHGLEAHLQQTLWSNHPQEQHDHHVNQQTRFYGFTLKICTEISTNVNYHIDSISDSHMTCFIGLT